MMFATANKRRDQKLTEGYLEYNPNLTTGMEDLSDWENKAFRYVGECVFSAITSFHLLIPVCIEV